MKDLNTVVEATEVSTPFVIRVEDVNGNVIPENIKMFLTKDNSTVLHTDIDNAREIIMRYYVRLGEIEVHITHPHFNQLVASMYSRIAGVDAIGLSYQFDSFEKFLGNIHRTAPSLMGGYEIQLESLNSHVRTEYDETSINVSVIYIIDSKEDFKTLQMAGFFYGVE